jgi:glutamine cyclotransferase
MFRKLKSSFYIPRNILISKTKSLKQKVESRKLKWFKLLAFCFLFNRLQGKFLFVFVLLFIFLACETKQQGHHKDPVDSLAIPFTILKTIPHDPDAFTEGLVIYDSITLESTGLNGQSWVAIVHPNSGEHTKKVILDRHFFGEGITALNNKLYHLTYQTKVGFVYSLKDFKKIKEFQFNTEGWGLTHNNESLIMSDGTEKLYFLDTTNLKVVKTLTVTDAHNNRLKNLNELEYINGYIFANLYQTSFILKIDPRSGKVIGRIDLSLIDKEIQAMFPKAEELNGIAYDPKLDALLVTGKFWPKSYLVRLH